MFTLNLYLEYLLIVHLSRTAHIKSSAIVFVSPSLFKSVSRILGICIVGEVEGNPYAFLLGNKTMHCAPGTLFNITVCSCVRYGTRIVCSVHAKGTLGLW